MVTEEDFSAVIEHLRASFFEDEPLNKAVQLCPAGGGHQELERQCVETMIDGYSIVAVLDGEVNTMLYELFKSQLHRTAWSK